MKLLICNLENLRGEIKINIILAYFKFSFKNMMTKKMELLYTLFGIVVIQFMVFQNSNYSLRRKFLMSWGLITLLSYISSLVGSAVRLREGGWLKTSFSIANKPFQYFFGCLLMQILYAFTCISVLNLLLIFKYDLNFFTLTALAIVFVIALIPIAFFAFIFMHIKTTHINIVLSIISAVFTGILVGISEIKCENYMLIYIITSIIMILIGSRYIKKFSPIPNERR